MDDETEALLSLLRLDTQSRIVGVLLERMSEADKQKLLDRWMANLDKVAAREVDDQTARLVRETVSRGVNYYWGKVAASVERRVSDAVDKTITQQAIEAEVAKHPKALENVVRDAIAKFRAAIR